MSSGLRYETGRDMPPGMAEKAAMKIAQNLQTTGGTTPPVAAVPPKEICRTSEEPVAALPVTKAELSHLINDTISYIWKLEDKGMAKPEYGYDSRKALLEKMKQFEKKHFPEWDTCSG